MSQTTLRELKGEVYSSFSSSCRLVQFYKASKHGSLAIYINTHTHTHTHTHIYIETFILTTKKFYIDRNLNSRHETCPFLPINYPLLYRLH